MSPGGPLPPSASPGLVAVVGASEHPHRYAFRALHLLRENGYTPIPVSRSGTHILGFPGYPSLAAIPVPIDTVTMYVSPERQPPIIADILAVRPRRVIFNPGAENPDAYPALAQAGVEAVEACTLVLLTTGQF